MKKENIIKLISYREQETATPPKINAEVHASHASKHTMSNELQIEIQKLIYRLRHLGPLQKPIN